MTKKHIRHCARCREFYEACLSLSEGLKHEAALPNRRASERLSTRILTVISHQAAEPPRVTVKWRPIAAAACVGLIVLMVVSFLAKRPQEQNITKYAEATQAVRDIVASADNLAGGRLTKADSTAAWSDLIERPLQSEIKNLAHDTESAVRFLVVCMRADVTAKKDNSIN